LVAIGCSRGRVHRLAVIASCEQHAGSDAREQGKKTVGFLRLKEA